MCVESVITDVAVQWISLATADLGFLVPSPWAATSVPSSWNLEYFFRGKKCSQGTEPHKDLGFDPRVYRYQRGFDNSLLDLERERLV